MLYLLKVDGIVAVAATGCVLGISGFVFLLALAFRSAKMLATTLYRHRRQRLL